MSKISYCSLEEAWGQSCMINNKNNTGINIDQKIYSQYLQFSKKLQYNLGKELTADELKQSKAYYYASVYTK